MSTPRAVGNIGRRVPPSVTSLERNNALHAPHSLKVHNSSSYAFYAPFPVRRLLAFPMAAFDVYAGLADALSRERRVGRPKFHRHRVRRIFLASVTKSESDPATFLRSELERFWR